MIIHIEVCDICQTINRNSKTLVPFKSMGNEWDVCGGCLKREKFRVVTGVKERKAHLLPRIEALVLSALALLKEPV